MSRHTIAALAALALVAACDKESTIAQNIPGGVAFVSVANATATPVKVYNGTTLVSTANIPNASWQTTCVRLAPGSQTITFKSTGDSILATTGAASVAEGGRYVAILTTNAGVSTASIVPDNFTTLTPNNYGVRIVNATGGAGDFYLTAAAASALNSTNLVGTLQPGDMSPSNGTYTTHRADTAFVRMYNVGNTTTQQGSINLASSALTTNTTWTMGATAIFTRDALNKIVAYTIGQCGY